MSCVEYTCISCGHFTSNNMRPVICDNPKCPNPTAGFALEWDERADFERELTVDDEGEEDAGEESTDEES